MRLIPGPPEADRARGSLVVPVALPPLAAEIDVLDARWAVKDEFHVTLADADWIAERFGFDPEELWLRVIDAGRRAPIRAVDLDPADLRLLRKGHERTIVAMAVAHGLPDLIDAMGPGVPLPPAHVTLYTRPGGEGVGIHDEAELNAITTPLSAAEVAAVRAASGL